MDRREMKCTPIRNVFEDESLYVPAHIEPDDIPSPYRELISDEYLAFLRHPQQVLQQLAAEARIASLQRWLDAVCKQNELGLIVHYADCTHMGGRIQSDLTITTSYLPSHSQNFRLPMGWDTSDLPRGLAELYAVMDGLIHGDDVFCAAGFNRMPSGSHGYIEGRLEFGMFIAKTPGDEELRERGAWGFYSFGTGDLLLAIGEEAYSWYYPDSSTKHQGSVADLVESFFECRLTGEPWHPFHF